VTETFPRRVSLDRELSPGAFALSHAASHNGSTVIGTGSLDITTSAERWDFAATFPFQHKLFNANGITGPFLVRVEATVQTGSIGIGCVAADLKTFISPEVEHTPENGDTVFDLIVDPVVGDSSFWLVVRNTASGGIRSRVLLRAIRTFALAQQPLSDLIDVEQLAIENIVDSLSCDGPAVEIAKNPQTERSPASGRRFERGIQRYQLLLTHTSRSWDWAKCSKDYLIQRYAEPNRLRDLPRFEDLPSQRDQQVYNGGLSILELAIDGRAAYLVARRCIDSRFKIQHANLAGGKLVLCFEDFLAVLPSLDYPLAELDLRPGSRWRIDDNWFGGLHTVFPVDDEVCIVSSSGADAVLWVDITMGKVIRRWRLPSELYGTNYDLTAEMSVAEHYIHNDIQLGHLNCAYPDGRGGVLVSTLIQGDVGHLDQNGKYSLLTRGFVGCHGVRLSRDRQYVYFTDSCNGRLMKMAPGGGAVEVRRVDSLWLHDVEQLHDELYCFSLGDKNELSLIDVSADHELGRFAFHGRGTNVQFISALRQD
jgi:hypothetical protein